MKKFLFIFALAAAVSVSCQKQCEVYAPDTNGEIVFRTNGVKVTTKAFAETTNDTLQHQGFKVAAVIDGATPSVMFNSAVKYNTTDQVYRVHNSTAEEYYYYPNEGTMSFYAAYPATQAIAVASGDATIAYTQNADTDLVVAKATGVGKQNSSVQLDFEHILSQVTMTVKTDDANVVCKLLSITVNDTNGGTYSFANETWTLSDTKANYDFYKATEGSEQVVTTTAASVGSAMSFMPGDITVNAKWKCYNKTGGALISDNDETVSVTLTKGEHITLNLTLPANSSELTFVTSVGPWANKEENITLQPDALVSINALEGGLVTLPTLNIASGTKGKVDWGDGTKEEFSNAETKSSVTDNKITFSHTYATEFTGNAKIYVETGSISGEMVSDEYEKFSINNAEKVNVHKLFIFKVSNSGKSVKFSPGNLYWNGSGFKFEEHQYDCPTSWDANHVGHFYWSKDARIAYAANYIDAISELEIFPATGEKFFAEDGGAVEGYTVLSKEEWDYLLTNALAKNSQSKNTITIDGKVCLVLKPDGFSGSVADSYTAETWVAAEASGLVALPFAGSREGSSFSEAESSGIYWSSSPSGTISAWRAYFGSDYASTLIIYRENGCSVRLVSVQ